MVQAFLPFIAATRIQSARAAGADPGFRKGGGGGGPGICYLVCTKMWCFRALASDVFFSRYKVWGSPKRTASRYPPLDNSFREMIA